MSTKVTNNPQNLQVISVKVVVIHVNTAKNLNQSDQSKNSIKETQQNVEKMGVSEVVKLLTGDMTKLNFSDNSFDFVVASFSIHNVKPKSSRKLVIDEAYRVLKPNGQIIILDVEHTYEYKKRLEQLGASEINIRNAGINGMYAILSSNILVAKK